MTGAVGPVAGVVTDVVHPGLRATAISTVTVTQNLFGLAVGPVLTGCSPISTTCRPRSP
jgi:MFS transporter, Spinster family, sphingosine-1-phosphate transporter